MRQETLLAVRLFDLAIRRGLLYRQDLIERRGGTFPDPQHGGLLIGSVFAILIPLVVLAGFRRAPVVDAGRAGRRHDSGDPICVRLDLICPEETTTASLTRGRVCSWWREPCGGDVCFFSPFPLELDTIIGRWCLQCRTEEERGIGWYKTRTKQIPDGQEEEMAMMGSTWCLFAEVWPEGRTIE